MFKRKLFILLFCTFTFFSLTVYANCSKKVNVAKAAYNDSGVKSSVNTISFFDNDQVSVALSKVDINRLAVQGDKISSLNGPTGLFTAKNDTSGAAYLTLYTNTPFTLYINTLNNHNVSLFVTPRSIIGKTYVFIPLSASKARTHTEETSTYQKLLLTLLSAMINKNTLDDYAYMVPKKTKCYDFNNIATLTPIAFYIGSDLNGVTYQIKNITDNPITFKTSYFYKQGVRAVALSKQTLGPNCVGFLYEVVSKE